MRRSFKTWTVERLEEAYHQALQKANAHFTIARNVSEPATARLVLAKWELEDAIRYATALGKRKAKKTGGAK